MSRYCLNLWLPGGMSEQASELCKELPNVHFCELEHWKEYCRENPGRKDIVNLVGMPTDGKIVLVSKKILSFHLKLRQSAEAKDVYFALWPKHPEYEVGVHVPEFLHQTFLPGMTTYNCVAADDGFLITAAAAPNAAAEQILEEIRTKLDTANLLVASLTFCGVIRDAYRAELDNAVFDAMVQTSLELSCSGPNFEWYPAVSSLPEIGRALPNTFAMGSGALPDPMNISWDENQSEKTALCLDDSFWAFVRAFSRMLQ